MAFGLRGPGALSGAWHQSWNLLILAPCKETRPGAAHWSRLLRPDRASTSPGPTCSAPKPKPTCRPWRRRATHSAGGDDLGRRRQRNESGPEPDSEIVFEVGVAVTLGLPVVACGVPQGTYADRATASSSTRRERERRAARRRRRRGRGQAGQRACAKVGPPESPSPLG